MGQEPFDLFEERSLHTGALADPADRSLAKEGLFRLGLICTKKGVNNSYKDSHGWKEGFHLLSGGLVLICSGGGGQ